MITLVWRSDVHLADQPPASRVDDWAETLLGKLIQVGDIAKHVGAKAVLDGGDFFHVKSPGRTSHRLMQRIGQIHAAYPCPTLGNIGNHDVKYGDGSFLDEAPLGVLFTTGVFQRCYNEHEHTFEQGGVSVRVVGVPYHGTKYDFERFKAIRKGQEDYLVVMAHVLASEKGGEMFESEDIIKYADLASLDADVNFFGHWHKNQGIQEIVPGKWVVNIGSLSRGALNQDDVVRIPSCVVLKFTSKGIELEERPLAVGDADDVFDIAGKNRQNVRAMTMEAFVETFKAALEDTQQKPLIDTVMEMEGVPQEVKEEAVLYLEQQK